MEQWQKDTDSESRSTRRTSSLLSICPPSNGLGL